MNPRRQIGNHESRYDSFATGMGNPSRTGQAVRALDSRPLGYGNRNLAAWVGELGSVPPGGMTRRGAFDSDVIVNVGQWRSTRGLAGGIDLAQRRVDQAGGRGAGARRCALVVDHMNDVGRRDAVDRDRSRGRYGFCGRRGLGRCVGRRRGADGERGDEARSRLRGSRDPRRNLRNDQDAIGVHVVARGGVGEHDLEGTTTDRVRPQLEPADAAIAPLGQSALALGRQDRLVDVDRALRRTVIIHSERSRSGVTALARVGDEDFVGSCGQAGEGPRGRGRGAATAGLGVAVGAVEASQDRVPGAGLRIAGLAIVDDLRGAQWRGGVVAEVLAGHDRAALDGDRVDGRIDRLGLDPVGLDDLCDLERTRNDTGERVIAAGVGERCGQDVPGGIEQVHRPVLQAGLARVAVSVTVGVVVHVAADADGPEVAEIQRGFVHTALGCERVVVGIDRLGLGPAQHQDLGDRERAGEQVVELIVPVGIAGGRGHDVPRRIEQVDRPALQARIARIEVAVAIQIVVNVARDVHELEVAEVERGLVRTTGGRDDVGSRRVDGVGLIPPALIDLLDRVGAIDEVREREAPIRGAGGRGEDVPIGIEQVDRPALQARIARLVGCHCR